MVRRNRLAEGGIGLLVALVVVAVVSRAVANNGTGSQAETYYHELGGRRPLAVSSQDFLIKLRRSPDKAESVRPDWLGPATRNPPADARELRAVWHEVQRCEARLSRAGMHVRRGLPNAAGLAQRADVEWVLPILHQPGSDVPIYLSDQLVVRFAPGVRPAVADEIIRGARCETLRSDERVANRYIVRVRNPRGIEPLTIANALHERADVLYAHPDFLLVRKAYNAGSILDPLYAEQWNLDGDVAKGASANADMNVEAAWDSRPDGAGEGVASIRVAIIDDSVEKDHPDLAANYWAGRDYDPSYPDPYDDDPSPDMPGQMHGTSCAGVAVASANTLGGRGVAPRCGLIGIKCFESSISETADAFWFAVDPNGDLDHSDGAAVISNSWGFVNGTLQPPDVVEAINDAARNGRNGKGCIVLFAAANDSYTVNGVNALAQLESVLCVGGSNSYAEHTEYSDVGPEVSVVAPTSDAEPPRVRRWALSVTTTDVSGDWGREPGDYTSTFGGTSAATPAVAGVCALVLSQDPTLTGVQVRAIVEHTAVQIDPAYAQIDGITGHSHRFGYGRVDAGAAVAAANAGIRWPAPVRGLTCEITGTDLLASWENPPLDFATALVVMSQQPFAWRPTDGVSYSVQQEVAPGVRVVQNNDAASCRLMNVAPSGYFLGVYACSPQGRYGWGAKCQAFRGGVTLFYDDSEGTDPGWVHGGNGDVWERDIPTSSTSMWDQFVYGGGPLSGVRNDGDRAIGGDRCWGTGLTGAVGFIYGYTSNSATYLRTPLIPVPNISGPVYLSFYDWCLLETPFDYCTIKVLDESNNVVQVLETNYGGDYDWTARYYRLGDVANRQIRVQFELLSDGVGERNGWCIDEVRLVLTPDGGPPPSSPPVASDVQASLLSGTSVDVTLVATDPDPSHILTFIIASLPAHGTLTTLAGAPIGSVPFTLPDHGRVVRYIASRYEGYDTFTFRATDGRDTSAPATATIQVRRPDADFDNDGDVDVLDFNFFIMCFRGANQPPIFPECAITDIDGDTDVDLSDFTYLTRCFNGPNNPMGNDCL